ncbi:hypothetical protein BKA70DRAFT_719487 [Coprinopsis sp. MPI-PUGE-AT-0042]|nr:hypothetical protein BKA70DRAFT_719487 [Coprinopsis sp. MPI-PUGE-AT-0042]
MATPTSSATSPSPPMAYLSHPAPTPQPMMNTSSNDPQDRDQRQKAVQKFLARAEISMVTRALRARLSYASYKATHNIPHVPLPDLEAQSNHNQAQAFSRTIAAKRKASAPYYYTPTTPGPVSGSPATGTLRKGQPGAMGPPSSVNSPRAHYGYTNTGQPASATHGEMASSSRHPFNTAPNLYTSILAPPPAKQARTIHNANDPPVPAPTRPAPSPRPRSAHKSPRTEVGRSHVKSRHSDRSSKSTNSPDRRRTKRSSADKGKRRDSARVDADGDVDMKAAATLTSLLLHHRPSVGSASSPRSSLDGSETGSTLSHSHFAQSSARTMSVASPGSAPATTPLAPAETPLPQRTPPPTIDVATEHSTTPRPVATEKDSEAADLMLFLATSPSPARSSKPRDQTTFQTLGGGDSARPKGRVLFQSGSGSDYPSGESSGGAGLLQPPSALLRNGEGSFTSSLSNLGAESGGSRSAPSPPMRTISSAAGAAPNQLLPPPSLTPLLPAAPSSPAPSKSSVSSSPKPSSQGTPIDFNIHDFINASPSPRSTTVPQAHKPNHSLRADVGRKLFEEEQMRFAALGKSPIMSHLVVAGGGGGSPGGDPRGEGQHPSIPRQTWTAGIDIVQG